MHIPDRQLWLALVPLALSCSSDEAAGVCHWPGASGSDFQHFSFLLLTPDGQAQSPPTSYAARPADAAWPINDFEGVIADQSGNQLAVDSCLSAPTCQPSLYRFVLCDSLPCVAAAAPAAIGLYWLAIYDGEPGATRGNLLFLGSGGYDPGPDPMGVTPFGELPFSVSTKPLLCGERDSSSSPGDDYVMVFSQTGSTAQSLQLATGESGVFHFTWPAGNAQTLQMHCLVAVQPDHTDDYWNWDFWAVGA
jgi:hypothetical protein